MAAIPTLRRPTMKRLIAGSIVGGALLLGTALSASADSPNAAVGFGTLFSNGGTIQTGVVPAALPNSGTDPLSTGTIGSAGHLRSAGGPPGSGAYHAAAWQL